MGEAVAIPDAPPTGQECLACGGSYVDEDTESGHRDVCRWCSEGIMAPEQVQAWRRRPSAHEVTS